MMLKSLSIVAALVSLAVSPALAALPPTIYFVLGDGVTITGFQGKDYTSGTHAIEFEATYDEYFTLKLADGGIVVRDPPPDAK